YRDVFYRRVSPLRRVRLHQVIGERLEKMSAGRITEAAAELAAHFQQSRDHARAIRYLSLLAQRSAARHALLEAVDALERALALSQQVTTELELIEQLGLVYRLMGQLTSSELEIEKMRELAVKTADRAAELRAQLHLAGVTSFLDRSRCLKAAEEAVALCEGPVGDDLRCNALGQAAYWNLLFRGWRQDDAIASARALEAARRGADRSAVALHASRHAFFLALSSRYRDAWSTAEEGIRIATEID